MRGEQACLLLIGVLQIECLSPRLLLQWTRSDVCLTMQVICRCFQWIKIIFVCIQIACRAFLCSTRLEAAQAPGSRRSSWRRSPPAMARWPGLNSPSTLRLRFERVEPTQKHSEHFCHRWPQLLWSHTTPSYRPIQALSQSMSVSLWTTRFRGFAVFWNLTMSDVHLSNVQAIYEICKRNLQVDRPTYTNLNRIIAQVEI